MEKMDYRKFGKLDWKASALGFGTMRLPVINGDMGNVDEPEAIRMLHYAIDHGVNYIDSAYGYHHGKTDLVIGKALQGEYKGKARVATKLPSPEIRIAEDFDRCLNEQLQKLQTGKIDFYLLHHLNRVTWPKLRDLGILKWADKAIADGRISYFGFSFHDSFEVLKEIIGAYDNWTMCQIQYNYMDEEFQAGTKGLEYAHNKGLAVVVMEPIRGGRLTRPPASVAKIWAEAPEHRTPQEWALRWVWNHPEVTLALSGMSTMQQVVENVASAERSQPHNLSKTELALIERARDAYISLGPVACTGCKYCMPCPNGVDIPGVFNFYNDAMIYGEPSRPRREYRRVEMFKESQRGDKCIKCNKCVEKCPQKVPIPEMLEKAHAFLTEK
jgi:predicted aldo/keto reductase-like oxidoreductase